MIRVASAADLDSIVALNAHVHDIHVAAHPERYRVPEVEALREWYAQALDDPGCTFFVARVDGRDCAYLRGVVQELPANPFGWARRDYEVDQLAVAPEGRRRGVGRALMRAAEARARALGCGRVALNVVAFNEGARAFYEDLGYEPLLVRMDKALG